MTPMPRLAIPLAIGLLLIGCIPTREVTPPSTTAQAIATLTPTAQALPTPARSGSAQGDGTPIPPSASAARPVPTPEPASLTPPIAPPPADRRPPRVIAVSGTQTSLTVTFDEPMQHALACGASGPAAGGSGAIDNAHVGEGPGHYTSPDRVYHETLTSEIGAAVSEDCTQVTFAFARAAPPGRWPLHISDVADLAGNTVDPSPTVVVVWILDHAPPHVVSVHGIGQSIYVTFNEPMLEIGEGGGVTLLGNYKLEGRPLPPGSRAVCLSAGCGWVRVYLPEGTLVTGGAHRFSIANAVDRAGKVLRPDPTTVTFVARDR